MIFIPQSFSIDNGPNPDTVTKDIEHIGRVCYKSEGRITPDSADRFVQNLIKRGHESVLEHHSITVNIITDRAIANELVRHRVAAYTQESTRYCNYTGEGIIFIKPLNMKDPVSLSIYTSVAKMAEERYNALIELGETPEAARDVLPLMTATNIIATCNLREWRHILRLRTDKAAHPKMRELMQGILKQFKILYPVIFEDIKGE